MASKFMLESYVVVTGILLHDKDGILHQFNSAQAQKQQARLLAQGIATSIIKNGKSFAIELATDDYRRTKAEWLQNKAAADATAGAWRVEIDLEVLAKRANQTAH